MKVGDLCLQEIESYLSRSELAFKIGGFDISLTTRLPLVAQDLHQLYSSYELSLATDLIDFHVGLHSPFGLRRWLRPQVRFYLDAQSPFKPLPLAQGFAMFEWGLNWCIAANAHQFLNIHAAVVERGGKALILPGAPGSGKSTLCAALVSHGWRLLSDEMTLISMDDGQVYPVPRPISLKNESIDIIRRLDPSIYIGRVVEDTAKGTVAHMRPPEPSVAAGKQTATAAVIVFPKFQRGEKTRLTEIGKGQTLLHIAEHSFNYHVLGVDGFSACGDLVDHCDCYEFTYEKLSEAIGAMEGLIDE